MFFFSDTRRKISQVLSSIGDYIAIIMVIGAGYLKKKDDDSYEK